MMRASLLALAGFLASFPQAADVPFAHRTIDANGPKDPWFKMLGDIDGDGYVDIVIGGQAGPLVWYAWPDWKKTEIAARGFSGVDGETGDVDGDGDVDIVMGGVVWFENPRIGGGGAPARRSPGEGGWKMHRINDFGAHDIEVSDLDRDGKLDVVARDQSGFGHNAGNKIRLYRQAGPDSWTKRTIDCPHGEGLKVADVNKDGLPDLVIAGRWYENPGDAFNGEWKERVYTSRWTHADVKVEVADFNGDGRPDIVLTPAEPAGQKHRASWFEAPADPRSGEWAEHLIADSVEAVVHGLAVGDLNGDGHVDVVTAAMHQGADPDEVAVWINQGQGKSWRKQVISQKGSHTIKIADIGNDGDLDILGANWSGGYQPIELWENQTKPTGPVRVHVFISGVVQGVSYRASTQEQAEKLGVVGWVRNLSDGRVEGVFQGPAEKVEELLKWCRKGPPAARVDKIETTREKAAEDLKGFEVKATK